MTYILIFFVIIFLIPKIFSFLLRLYLKWQVHKFNKRVNNSGASNFRDNGNNQQQAKKKKIDSSVGEYIDFTELPSTTEQSSSNDSSQQQSKSKTEDQIADIEWEDIN